MFTRRLVATGVLAAFLSATVMPASAQTSAPQPSPLRASIDRAASKSAQITKLPQQRPTRVRKAATQGGGGGGMMVMTVIMTVAGLAATYFVIKEMNKETDELTNQQ